MYLPRLARVEPLAWIAEASAVHDRDLHAMAAHHAPQVPGKGPSTNVGHTGVSAGGMQGPSWGGRLDLIAYHRLGVAPDVSEKGGEPGRPRRQQTGGGFDMDNAYLSIMLPIYFCVLSN